MAYDLQKEDDAKEYIENLGIEYRFGCFKERNPESCHLLGDYLEAVKSDFAKAAKVYGANCDASTHSRSCYKIGSYNYSGKGIKKNLTDAFKYFEKSCTAGDKDACLHAGMMCTSKDYGQDVVPLDYVKGIKLLEDACSKDNGHSCHYLSSLYITGVEEGITKDMTKAFDYASKACQLNNMFACANVSQMAPNMVQAFPAPTKASQYFPLPM